MIEKHFSCYLDASRFCAACLVVLDHIAQYGMLGSGLLKWTPELGRFAVIFFFLLSGYVIAYSSSTKHQTLRQYVIARCARIYSVALPILFLVFALAEITHLLHPYSILNYQLAKIYLYLPFHLLFLGELWNFSETPPWLIPYWSLGYEVWYYVLFGIVYFFRGPKRVALTVICLMVMGHKLWLLMPIWWSGVLFFHYQDKFVLNKNLARIGWLGSILLFCVYKYWGGDQVFRELGNQIWHIQSLKLESADRYLSDYLTAIIFLGNFYFARNAQFQLSDKFANRIKAIASYTFTLYLIHAVILFSFIEWYPYSANNMLDLCLLLGVVAAATFSVGSLTETRKSDIARLFDRLLDKIIAPEPSSVVTKKMSS